jgi:uncharacterized protein YodC (DUF2158 family)
MYPTHNPSVESKHIKAGDTVVLKAGGPVMKVHATSQGLAYCSWFEGDSARHSTFAVDSLQPDTAQAGEAPEPIKALAGALEEIGRKQPRRKPPASSGAGD